MSTPEMTEGFVRPEGLVNLSAQYPLYDGGDARILKVGTRGAPIHGRILGVIDLPSVQKNEDGTAKEWLAFVIELLQPAPASDAGEDSTILMRQAGERIALTISKALEKFIPVGEDRECVYEVFVQPKVSRNKKNQPLWVYPTFEVGRPIKRLSVHQVAIPGSPRPALHAADHGHALVESKAATSLPVS